MTKYARQIKSARATITRKGTTATWFKPGAPVNTDDPTPEFSELGPGAEYVIPIVYVPATASGDYTNTYQPDFNVAGEFLLAIIPGDVPFTPENNDTLLVSEGNTRRVDAINTTAPDGTPIIHELRLK